jgi:hypothetical protein
LDLNLKKKKVGKLGGKLRVVGMDLNLLDGSASHLNAKDLHEVHFSPLIN